MMQMKSYLVIDLVDVQQALVKEDILIFTEFQKRIEQSREARGLTPNPGYVICNAEEPYAQFVTEVMRQGDAVKQAHQMLAALTQQLNSMVVAAAKEQEPKELDLDETKDPD
jgi:hypothetical protein